MTFSYRYEEADWIAFYRHYLRNVWRCRRPRLRTGILLVALVVSLVMLAVRARQPEFPLALAVLTAFFAFSLYCPRVWEPYLVRRFEATVAHPANAKKFSRKTMTLTPEYIHLVDHGSEAKVAWDRCVHADRTDDHIFVYVGAVEALVIPHASLEGAAFDEIWTQIKQYMGERDEFA